MDFKPGDRVRLVYTDDQYTRLRPGDTGTVTVIEVSSLGTAIGMKWDSGSQLSMLPGDGDVIEPE